MSYDTKLIDYMYQAFVVRRDAYVLQYEDGYVKVDKRIGFSTIYRHLAGEITVGVYSIAPGNYSKWIVFDLDVNPRENAKRLLKYLEGTIYAKSVLIEKTGGRGYHIWILFNELYPTPVLRRIGIEILNNANVVSAELFPKQDEIAPNGYGNAVRLPLGIHRKTGKRSVLLYPESLLDVERCILPETIIIEKMLEYRVLNNAIDDFKPPSHSTFARCVAFKRIRMGVVEGFRDESAFFLARFYHWLGLPKTDAYILLSEWDKLNKPPLGHEVIRHKVDSAYENKYYVGLSSIYENDVLRAFCVGCRNEDCKGFKTRKGVITDNVLE